MLQLTVKPHRAFLRANAGAQKLFVMLKMLPSLEAAAARPRINVAVVIDTSGSMREPAPGAAVQAIPTDPVTVDGKTYNATDLPPIVGPLILRHRLDRDRRTVESPAGTPPSASGSPGCYAA